jgi:hypothetical protein
MPNPVPNQLERHAFTSESASIAGKRSAEARRARKLLAARDAATLAQQLDNVRSAFTRNELGPNAAAVAGQLMSRVLTGDIPVRNGDEAAALLRVLVDVARLEAGEATAHSLHATISTEQAVERIGRLQEAARQAISTTSSPTTSSPSAAAQAAPDVDAAGDDVPIEATAPSQ